MRSRSRGSLGAPHRFPSAVLQQRKNKTSADAPMWVIRKLQKTEVRSPRSRLRWFWDLPFSPSSLSQTSIFQLALSESSLIRCILLPRAVSFSVKILDVAKARCRTILRGRLTFFTSTLRSRRLTFCSKPALPLHRCEQRIRPGESSFQEGCRNELTAFEIGRAHV